MIKLYVGISETVWNHHPTAPGPFTCISPVYGKTERTKKENRVKIPKDTIVIQDSGAFSDGPKSRLSFSRALDRQLLHATKYNYANQVSHLASYDLLIDEVWVEGNRSKRRWSENDAEMAVKETINAAKFISQRHLATGKILSAQGVTPEQYLQCVEQVLYWVNPVTDIFGLGGWCIIGKMRKIMMPVFIDTIKYVIPFLAKNNIKRVHIWGVVFPFALGKLLHICDEHGIELSTDSSGPQWRPAFGEWGYGDWRNKNYKRVSTDIRGLHRAEHVVKTRDWLLDFRHTQYYTAP
jgi:hypothetical protein